MTQTSLCWIDAPAPRCEPAGAALASAHVGHGCLDALSSYGELTGLPFGLADLDSEMLTYAQFAELCPLLPVDVARAFRDAAGPYVVVQPHQGLVYYGLDLPPEGESKRVAAGFVPLDRQHPSEWLRDAARDAGWTAHDLQQWLDRLEPVTPGILPRLLHMAARNGGSAASLRSARQVDDLASQLDAAYEELSLLHDLVRNLRVSLDPIELAQMCLNRLQRTIRCAGCGIVLAPSGAAPKLVTDGALPCSEEGLQQLLASADMSAARRPIVRNNLDETSLAADFPELRNYIAAAILEGDAIIGWIVACNSEDRPEFGTVEASLLNSIALILSTHLNNIRLFLEQDELLVAFVRSLVSTLDAKDSYTRGHSERVALIARRLSKQLGLPDAEQEAIHLAALLHDIGKVGVADAILGKPGRLTEAEFRILQMHPVIGHDILSGLTNLQHIIPGVRHHHENYDGTGYPDKLQGEDIPLMARILAVADAFDAMGSDRPYRGGMPLEQIERILTDGAGTQWDVRVVRAYFAARDDVRRVWETSREAPERLTT